MPLNKAPYTRFRQGFLSEFPGSGKMHFSRAGITGLRTFDVPWQHQLTGERYMDVITRLLGYSEQGQDDAVIIHYPDYFDEDFNWLYCQQLDLDFKSEFIKGYQENNRNRIKYDSVMLNCTYAPLDVGMRWSLSTNVLPIVGAHFAWTGSSGSDLNAPPGSQDDYFYIPSATPALLSQDVGKIVPLGEFIVERRQVLLPSFRNMIDLLGTVNAGFFLGLEPWTLLLAGIEASRVRLANATLAWDMTFRMLYNPNEHNKLYDPTGMGNLVHPNDGTPFPQPVGLGDNADGPDYTQWQAGFYYVRTVRKGHFRIDPDTGFGGNDGTNDFIYPEADWQEITYYLGG